MKKKGMRMLFALGVFLFIFLMVPGNKTSVYAAGNYYLQINKATNVVTVFDNSGKPVHAFLCSVGPATPIGTFYTSERLRWHTLYFECYGQYCTRITGDILFHSVYYLQNGNPATQSYSAFNRLGTMASHGCVRLTVADAKWIYDNCPLHTKVVIINGSAANDPLGKPAAIKVDERKTMGWDPTDPDPRNPYASTFPSINTSAKTTSIRYGASFSPLAGISAKDSLGNDISDQVTYKGSVNTKRLGSYTLSYYVRDAMGRTAEASVTFQVVDTKKAIISGVKKKLVKEYASVLKLRAGVSARTVDNTKLTKKITIKVTYPGTKKARVYKKKKLKLSKLGTYKIYYSVVNPHNQKVTKKTSRITVKDTKNPKLTGISSAKTVEYNSTQNLMSGVSAKLVSGKSLTKKIAVSVREPQASSFVQIKQANGSAKTAQAYTFAKTGTYEIQYSVSNPSNTSASTVKTMLVSVVDTKAPQIVIAGDKPSQAFVGDTYDVFYGVTARLVSGTALGTDKLSAVLLEKPSGSAAELTDGQILFDAAGEYKIVYRAVNPVSNLEAEQKTITIVVVEREENPTEQERETEAVSTERMTEQGTEYEEIP